MSAFAMDCSDIAFFSSNIQFIYGKSLHQFEIFPRPDAIIHSRPVNKRDANNKQCILPSVAKVYAIERKTYNGKEKCCLRMPESYAHPLSKKIKCVGQVTAGGMH